MIPLWQSFRVRRPTHLEHHRHTNDPARDPDYEVHAEDAFDFLKKRIGSNATSAYADTLIRIGREDVLKDALAYELVYLGVLFGLAWTGYALEVALLWWLPRHVALIWIQFYLAWMPHHPGISTNRYGDTRAFKSLLGNIWSGGMQYHIVHHLYPTIPLMQTPAAYRALEAHPERKAFVNWAVLKGDDGRAQRLQALSPWLAPGVPACAGRGSGCRGGPRGAERCAARARSRCFARRAQSPPPHARTCLRRSPRRLPPRHARRRFRPWPR